MVGIPPLPPGAKEAAGTAGKGILTGAGKFFGGIGSAITAKTHAIAGASFFGGGAIANRFVKNMPPFRFIIMFLFAAIVSYLNYILSFNRTARVIIYLVYFLGFYFLLRKNFNGNFLKAGLFYMLIGIFAADIGNYVVSISVMPELLKTVLLFLILLFGYLGPILLLMVFTNHDENWLSTAAEIGLVIFILFFAIAFFASEDIFGAGQEVGQEQKSMLTNILKTVWDSVRGTPGVVKGIINDTSQKLNQSVAQIKGQGYEEEVDKKSGLELGLKLSPLEFSNTDTIYYQGDPVSAWTVLEASSLDRTMKVNTGCYIDRRWETEIKSGDVSPSEFNVNNVGYKDIVCKFDRDELTKVDGHEMEIVANFSFSTSSYLRRYFIDEEDYVTLMQNDIDPLQHYQIPVSDEDSRYTVGPISLAVKKPNILHALSDDANEFVIAVEVDVSNELRQNNGKILKINKLVLALPSGFKLSREGGRYDCGQYEFVDYAQNSTYTQYRLETDSETNGLSMKDDEYKTKIVSTPLQIPCFVEPSKNTILDRSSLAIKNFRAYADYDFQVSTVKSFSIQDNPNYDDPNNKGIIPGCAFESAYLNSELTTSDASITGMIKNAEKILDNVSNVVEKGSLICSNILNAVIVYQSSDGSSNMQGYGYTEITESQMRDVGIWEDADLTNVEKTHADIPLLAEYLSEKKKECGNIDCALGMYLCGKEDGGCVETLVPLVIEIAERLEVS